MFREGASKDELALNKQLFFIFSIDGKDFNLKQEKRTFWKGFLWNMNFIDTILSVCRWKRMWNMKNNNGKSAYRNRGGGIRSFGEKRNSYSASAMLTADSTFDKLQSKPCQQQTLMPLNWLGTSLAEKQTNGKTSEGETSHPTPMSNRIRSFSNNAIDEQSFRAMSE